MELERQVHDNNAKCEASERPPSPAGDILVLVATFRLPTAWCCILPLGVFFLRGQNPEANATNSVAAFRNPCMPASRRTREHRAQSGVASLFRFGSRWVVSHRGSNRIFFADEGTSLFILFRQIKIQQNSSGAREGKAAQRTSHFPGFLLWLDVESLQREGTVLLREFLRGAFSFGVGKARSKGWAVLSPSAASHKRRKHRRTSTTKWSRRSGRRTRCSNKTATMCSIPRLRRKRRRRSSPAAGGLTPRGQLCAVVAAKKRKRFRSGSTWQFPGKY